MASIWQAPAEIQKLVMKVKEEHHSHLHLANIWCLVSDSKGIRDNKIIATQSRKCTITEHLSTGSDFKIIVMMETWSKLTDPQREIAIDEALCRCGVHREPQVIEINGKKMPLKDDLGRTIFSDDIAYDKEGRPRWKINQPDAGVYFNLLSRRGMYNEEVDNVSRVMAGKPIMEPIAAERADISE